MLYWLFWNDTEPATPAPGSARLPQLPDGNTATDPAGPTKQGSTGPGQQTALPETALIGRLPTAGARTLSPPKSSMSKPSVIFVVSPQVSAWPRVMVQSTNAPPGLLQLPSTHWVSGQSSSLAQLGLPPTHDLKMLAPWEHCAHVSPGIASASASRAPTPNQSVLLTFSM